ncbi:hypothetical protein ABEF95_000957 [Exophiala dermatitidis]
MSSRRDTIVVAAPLNGSLSTNTNLACDFESAISTLSSFSTSGSSDLSGILKADQTRTKTSPFAAAVSSPNISIATNEIGFEVEAEVVDVAAADSTTVHYTGVIPNVNVDVNANANTSNALYRLIERDRLRDCDCDRNRLHFFPSILTNASPMRRGKRDTIGRGRR